MALKIEVFGTTNCKKCVNIRDLLDSKQVDYVDHLIDLMPLKKDEMMRRSGRKQYPQVFVDGRYLGGEADLLMLEHEGRLDTLLGIS
ncbi:MAG: glutaredoxin domain-containing protein [Pseudomonadota bacterium]